MAKVYAEVGSKAAAQGVLDGLAIVIVVLAIRAGMWLHDAVAMLAAPGAVLEDGGSAISRSLDIAADAVQDVPLVGGTLSAPFRGAAEAGLRIAAAGQAQQDAVMSLALWLGVIVAAFAILLVLLGYLPGRLRWIREASAAAALRDDPTTRELLAHRALATRPLRSVARALARAPVEDDPTDTTNRPLTPAGVDALAALELRDLGLHDPAAPAARPATRP